MHVMLMRTNGKALPYYWTHSLPARSLASPFSYYRAQVRKPKFHLAAFPHAPCLFAQTHPLSPFSPPYYLRRIVCGNACAILVPLCKAKRIRSQIKSGRLTTRYTVHSAAACAADLPSQNRCNQWLPKRSLPTLGLVPSHAPKSCVRGVKRLQRGSWYSDRHHQIHMRG